MGEKTADDEAKDTVADPVISADAPAEPSLMDKALSAVGFGNKPEDAAPADASEATAATVATAEEDAATAKAKAEEDAATAKAKAEEDAAAAKAKADEDAAAAKAKAEEEAATSAPDNNVSMMDRITNVFKGDEKNDVTTTSAVSSDDGSDDGSDESSDDTEEDNGVDFEKYADEIRTLRNKYQKLKAENKKLKEGKKSGPVENNNSEFSKMIASLFAIKGSVAQLEYSMKKHAGHNNYPVEGLGLDDDTNNNEEQEKPSEIVSDSESESDIGSGSDSEPEPEVPEVMSPPPAPAPAPIGEIPEIPVNTQEVPAEVPAPEVPAPEVPAPEVPAPEVPAPEVPAAEAPATPPATTNALFSGGKNHYVHNIKKNKTLRHHKRRNRHQTLRTTQNS
jgi:hypothetical protein